RLRRYTRRSWSFLSCSSLSEPVTSFLYREMNGIVLPSSISLTAASICQRFTPNSSVSLWLMSIFFFVPLCCLPIRRPHRRFPTILPQNPHRNPYLSAIYAFPLSFSLLFCYD